jgi:hypothetical protein
LKNTKVKENLLAFSGVVYEDEEKGRALLEAKLNGFRKIRLEHVSALLGLNPKGAKATLVENLITWLEHPKDTGKSYDLPAPKKRKRSTSRSESPSKKAKKAKKDPDAPKRPRSAYLLFTKDHREKVVKKYPTEKVTQIIQRLAKMWKEADDEEKKKYLSKAKKDQARYKTEMEAYEKKKE